MAKEQSKKTVASSNINANKSTSVGLDENIEALLAYLFNIIGGLVFYFIEKKSKFVRFHSMQSILFNIAVLVIFVILGILGAIIGFVVPLIGGLIMGLLFFLFLIAFLVIWILLMYKSFKHEMYYLPVIGKMAEKYAQ